MFSAFFGPGSYPGRAPEPPTILATLRKPEVEVFVRDFKAYKEAGGSDPIRNFLSDSLVILITYGELQGHGIVTDDDFEEFLEKVATSPDVQSLEKIKEVLQNQVFIDTSEETGALKIQSLFLSLEKAILTLNLKETPDTPRGICFPQAKQVAFLLSKLPRDFLRQVEKRMVFMQDIRTKGILYKVLLDEVEKYNGSWSVNDSNTPFELRAANANWVPPHATAFPGELATNRTWSSYAAPPPPHPTTSYTWSSQSASPCEQETNRNTTWSYARPPSEQQTTRNFWSPCATSPSEQRTTRNSWTTYSTPPSEQRTTRSSQSSNPTISPEQPRVKTEQRYSSKLQQARCEARGQVLSRANSRAKDLKFNKQRTTRNSWTTYSTPPSEQRTTRSSRSSNSTISPEQPRVKTEQRYSSKLQQARCEAQEQVLSRANTRAEDLKYNKREELKECFRTN